MTTVAIVGLGEIGIRVARHLIAGGHAVGGYDLDARKVASLGELGGKQARSPSEAAHAADLVLTCVTDGMALLDVLEGPGGVSSSSLAGKTVIDLTSAEPWISRPLAERLAAAGAGFLDAPVSGGVPAAEAARMNFMVGGDAALLARWKPLLSLLGQQIAHVGPAGTGHTAKGLNMMALAGNMLVALEAMAVARRLGTERAETNAYLLECGAGSYSCRVHFPRYILPGTYNSGFSFDLMLKDLGIGHQLMEKSDQAAGLPSAVMTFYDRAQAELRGRDNTLVDTKLDWSGQAPANLRGQRLLEALGTVVRACNTSLARQILATGAGFGIAQATLVDVLSAGSGHSDVLSGLAKPVAADHSSRQNLSLAENTQFLRFG